jgi:PAS domain S-box-containing protein
MLTLPTEHSFKALLNSAPDAMVIIDIAGKIELVNVQTERLFGYNRNELIGQDVEILIPQRYRNGHYEKKASFLQSPEIREMGSGLELYALRSDGSEFLVEIALSYLKLDGRMSACAAIRDITDRKMLEKQKALLVSIVENSNDGIITINSEHKIITWNEGARRIFGYSFDEVVGKNINILIPPDKANEVKKLSTKIFKSGETHVKETVRLHKNGKSVPVSVSLSPVKDADGNIVGVSKIVRNIAKQKAAKKKITQLNQQKQDLEQKLVYHKQLEDFAYICSHNLRSPVGNLNSLFLMYDKQTDEAMRETIISKLRLVTQHLSGTLNELSKALSIKTDISIERTQLQFSGVLKKLIESVEESINTSGAVITNNFSKCPTINYPCVYLESILLNFLTNAIKYSSPNRKPKIHFETFVDAQNGRVMKVKDNGIGIDLHRHHDKIFGLHKTFHRNEDAKGVGLFITKAQIEAMGGSVTVESEVNNGSVFTVYFDKVVQP